jgi:hypothetical protein
LEENELKIAANSLKHEISAMEVKLAEKNKLAENQVNAIMKVSFEIYFLRKGSRVLLRNWQKSCNSSESSWRNYRKKLKKILDKYLLCINIP